MSIYTKLAQSVFAAVNSNGTPRQIVPAEAAIWGTEVERSIEGAVAGRVDQVTWAELAAITGTREGQPARVVGPDAGTHLDPVVGGTVANVGEYTWSVSPAGWRRTGNLVRTLVHAINSGAGTPSTVQAIADVAFNSAPYAALITINFTAANPGPMTLEIDAESPPRELVTNTGAAIPANYVQPGMSALVQIDSNGDYRMFSYGDATAVQAAAEAALAGAEAAALVAQAAQAAAEAAAEGVEAVTGLDLTGIQEDDFLIGTGPGSAGIASPAVVRPIIMGATSPFSLEWPDTDLTGVVSAETAWGEAVASGRAIHAPMGKYRFTAAKTITANMKLSGDFVARRDAGGGVSGPGTVFLFDAGVEGFVANAGAALENIHFSDFQIRQAGNWGANTNTALFLSDVYSSRFTRVRANYHEYGFFLRRTDPLGGAGDHLPNYFNIFDQCETFGCKYGFTDFDNGATNNKNSFMHCRSEDNGQRSGGYGIKIESVGTLVHDFYGGLPSHDAALVIGPAALGCTFSMIYGESETLTCVIRDESPLGRPNTIIGVHSDGVAGSAILKDFSNNDNTYTMAGSQSNTWPEHYATLSPTSAPGAIAAQGYDFLTFNIAGLTENDTILSVNPPGSWPDQLIKGEPRVYTDNFRFSVFNGHAANPETPPASGYLITYIKRT